ncbi:bifunctional alpha/beta hydrolase/OsmC family protein [Parvularcula lutaonensis]|uniref:Alpha/beta fold hydrolase n=1 Tax=Parvularcula lutaonensis TaxID=491923 RepID=A0ABV7MD60_9PROT|nr:bifunctional alpha/beta hydrolase/OsmC family protein [Parvularcula lutaonensis]GGY39781.1 osmotically inducible protein C [Parvularcula lutaonensis]
MAKPVHIEFDGAGGAKLSARLDMPAGMPKAFALFAHCFTCSKDLTASRAVATALTKAGIAVLRFDFTGLGGSGGDFVSTNFTMNLGDLKAAAQFLSDNYEAPALLVGHSLGGAAVIAVARDLPSVKAVATIAAPADTSHVAEQFGGKLDEIHEKGEAEVSLADRPFRIRKQFLDDLEAHDIEACAAELKRPFLILHAPTDDVVGIDNATRLFVAAKHPKSFISLDTADHLLSKKEDAAYAANVIAAWAERYIGDGVAAAQGAEEEAMGVEVRETGQGKFQALVKAGPHRLLADEPTAVKGGLGTGPSPYEYLSIALGACTTMTIRMYADFKKLPLDRVTVKVDHEKRHADGAADAMEKEPPIDHFTRKVSLEGELSEEQRQRILQIADRCPVHRTLERGADIDTREEPAT